LIWCWTTGRDQMRIWRGLYRESIYYKEFITVLYFLFVFIHYTKIQEKKTYVQKDSIIFWIFYLFFLKSFVFFLSKLSHWGIDSKVSLEYKWWWYYFFLNFWFYFLLFISVSHLSTSLSELSSKFDQNNLFWLPLYQN